VNTTDRKSGVFEQPEHQWIGATEGLKEGERRGEGKGNGKDSRGDGKIWGGKREKEAKV